MNRKARVLLLVLAAVLALAGCKGSASSTGSASSAAGSGAVASASTSNGVALDANGCPTDNTITLAKTKFVLHAGLAFGTFHRYLYKPYKAGTFSKGARGRLSALVKGAATAVFDVHEIKLAEADVKADPALCRAIIVPLQKLDAAFDTLKSKIRGGDTSGLEADNTMAASITSASASDGTTITESTDESAG